MRNSISAVAILLGTAALVLAQSPAGPAKERFACKLAISRPNDIGARETICEPTLITEDGTEASFLAGGETKVDLGAAEESITFGNGARLKIHRIADGKLRIYLYATHAMLDSTAKGAFAVREVGTHAVGEIALGEPFTVEVDGGWRFTATVITPDSAK